MWKFVSTLIKLQRISRKLGGVEGKLSFVILSLKFVTSLVVKKIKSQGRAQAAQAHYVWVRASEVIWSEYTRIISVLSDAK